MIFLLKKEIPFSFVVPGPPLSSRRSQSPLRPPKIGLGPRSQHFQIRPFIAILLSTVLNLQLEMVGEYWGGKTKFPFHRPFPFLFAGRNPFSGPSEICTLPSIKKKKLWCVVFFSSHRDLKGVCANWNIFTFYHRSPALLVRRTEPLSHRSKLDAGDRRKEQSCFDHIKLTPS